MSVSDEIVAAWSKEQNRGVPPWECLDEGIRQWWRDIYVIRHQTIQPREGKEA